MARRITPPNEGKAFGQLQLARYALRVSTALERDRIEAIGPDELRELAVQMGGGEAEVGHPACVALGALDNLAELTG